MPRARARKSGGDGVHRAAPTPAAAEVVFAIATTVVVLTLVWAQPRAIDDLYVALAGGREIAAGALGTPDDWAFTTGGRTWLNQNWGTHLLFHFAYTALGESGLLALKAGLIAAVVLVLVLVCRARGVRTPLALVVAAGALVAGRTFVDLRPNLMSLVLAPLVLWTLVRARDRPARAWLTGVVVIAWGNLHGGFLLGLGLLGLWTVCDVAAWARHAGVGAALRRARPLIAASVVTPAVLAVANPFGIVHLTHAATVAAHPVWRTSGEWLPVFSDRAGRAGTVWELFVVVGLLLLLALLRLGARRRRPRGARADPAAVAQAAFDVCAGVVVVAMALSARRFIPLVFVLMAPVLAVQLTWLAGRRRRWPTLAVGLVLLLFPLADTRPMLQRYRAEHPIYPEESLFARMMDVREFPAGAAAFLRANGWAGPVFNAYEHEGFLRWTRTPVRVFVGSRAQQVYDTETMLQWKEIRRAERPPAEALARRGLHLAVVPTLSWYGRFAHALVSADPPRWAYVYYDGRHAVLADARGEPTADLVARAARGTLEYPSPRIAALSRLMALGSPVVAAEPAAIRAAAEAANALGPEGITYAVLADLALRGGLSLAECRAYLAAEERRLAASDENRPGGLAVLGAREWIARAASALARAADRPREAEAQAEAAAALAARADALRARWGALVMPDVARDQRR